MKYSISRKHRIQTAVIITICILLQNFSGIFWMQTKAADTDNWIIYNEEGSRVEENSVRWTRTHSAGKINEPRYRTVCYFMSITPFRTSEMFTSSYNSAIRKSQKIYVDIRDKGQDTEEAKTRQYSFDRQEFISLASDSHYGVGLGITAEYIRDHGGKVTVYLNPVYDRYKVLADGSEVDLPGDFIFGYQEMKDYGFNVSTELYNVPFTITAANIFNVKIEAVDRKTNTVLETLKTREAIYNEDITYSLPKNKNSIKKGEKEYKYAKTWSYSYTKRNGSIYKMNDGQGSKINISAPDAKPGTTITFKMYYDLVATPETPTPTPTSVPEAPEDDVPPEPDSEHMEFTTIEATGVLRADVRNSERFVATIGIPTTESLYGEVIAPEYLLGYDFEKKVGIKYFEVKVKKDFILEWYSATPNSSEGSTKVTETVTKEYVITVPRAYGYWEINNLECYIIHHADLYNYALPNGSISIHPNNSYYTPPNISVYHSDNQDYHVLPPDEARNGIILEPETIKAATGQETRKPSIPLDKFITDAKNTALKQTGKAKVRSDSLIFNGDVVISDEITDKEAPDIDIDAIPQCDEDINENVLYQPNNIIEATKYNGIYPTTGTITYTALAKIGSSKPVNPQFIINGLDEVELHTPVVCIPTITADNDKYVQLIDPTEGCVELVLDPDPNLSDFTVHISNTGFHTGKQGYFTRDFSKAIRDPAISYIAMKNGLLLNQVKFPFDVYIDTGTLYVTSDDDFIKAGTWVTIDRATPRFYLPMTTNEGVYTVDFRTVAVNGILFLSKTEAYANTQLNNYVATSTKKVEVSGRIYGLTVYDLTDYPIWEEVFRVSDSMSFKKDDTKYPNGTGLTGYNSGRAYTYTLGTNDQYGNDTGRNSKFTFPLVNGSHPRYKNQGILKTGYMVRFSLDTIGNMFSDACKISIKPSFYYVDKDGNNRVAVDLYYTEAINNKTYNLVKVGSKLDQINLKSYCTGDLYLGIPKAELLQTATLRGMSFQKLVSKYEAMFNFSSIRLNYAFRTYVNNAYLSNMKAYASYGDVLENGITDADIQERMQRWYGQYYIPNKVHVVKKGFDVMDYADKYGVDYSEDFWLKDGYIIVNFSIETIDENGNHRLSYINPINYRDNGNCSMWLTEGPVTSKTSYEGATFHFYAGDFIVYYANKRMSDDYDTRVIY